MTKEEYEYALVMIDSLQWDIDDAKREIKELQEKTDKYESENPDCL